MILMLSSRFQKQISICLMYLFLLSGVSSWAYTGSSDQKFKGSFNYTVNSPASVKYDKYNQSKLSLENNLNDYEYKSSTDRLETVDNVDKVENLGGPSQPEMSGFKPVGSDNMVDLFSGDFSYNIPLLDVGGYPVNIFYNSGITMDQEASWVGLGWNINPGTIMRNMRGIPDDFNGTEQITKTQYTRAERTYGVSVAGSLKIFPIPFPLGLSANIGAFYNNMRGIGFEMGVTPSLSIGAKNKDPETAALSLSWGLQANSQTGGSSTFSISHHKKNGNTEKGSMTASLGYNSRMGLQSLHLSAEASKTKTTKTTETTTAPDGTTTTTTTSSTEKSSFGGIGSSIGFAFPAVTPSIRSQVENNSYHFKLGLGGDLWGIFGNAAVSGYYTQAKIPDDRITISKSAYGMLFMQDATNNADALMDFNRLNEGVYTPSAPTISIPSYTYDIFTISGEGTGGSFKAKRSDLGYVCDPYQENGGGQYSLGADLGGGSYGKFGINGNLVFTPSNSGVWNTGNIAKSALAFKKHDGLYRSVYFKNPGEKAIEDNNFQAAIGDEDMVRLKMTNTGMGSPTLLPTILKYDDLRNLKYTDSKQTTADEQQLTYNNTQRARDKRTQVITFLTNEEASRAGIDRNIVSVKDISENAPTFFGNSKNCITIPRVTDGYTETYRQPHHISEISVLQSDGKRYVYGIPVYNTKQVDVSFNSNSKNNTVDPVTQMANYSPGTDDVAGKNGGKDEFLQKQEMPGYTHSFLLTELLSPNYVDVTGDGITEDDLGDAVKFNYGKIDKPFNWRTPHGFKQVSYSEGLKLTKDDDKSHYIYGEREMWYMHSVESKNMVARFYVSDKRCDGKSAIGENGGVSNWGALKLNKISLFSKADLSKEQNDKTHQYKAKPIKSVYFEYDYSLCPNVPDNSGDAIDKNDQLIRGNAININADKGKLTLRRIYFTYNGNEKEIKNSYSFNYESGTKNPKYDYTSNDRWGNYKPNINPGGLLNADYPYCPQDKKTIDSYTGAWVLNKVQLPSGGTIKVDYESDDYAYVQDRRASNMFRIIGFGDNVKPNSKNIDLDIDNPDPKLKHSSALYDFSGNDYDFIYAKVTKEIDPKQDIKSQIKEWYLGNFDKSKQIFLKLAVNISTGSNSGYELIPMYADVIDYGLADIPGRTSNDIIYLQVKKLESGLTPMTQFSLQFMKNNLPGKAYPAYDVSDQSGVEGTISALAGAITSFAEIFSDQMNGFKRDGKCRWVDVDKAFVRLTAPDCIKYGGGLRVKKITIDDSWNKMTADVNKGYKGMKHATYGQEYLYTKKELVNGSLADISSGVASWEPSIGGEENPHREMINYFNKNKMGPYDYATVELPLAEMFYPSPSVGYSRVEVRSIHNNIDDPNKHNKIKNEPGIQVTEYYTAREFPTKSNYTPLEEHDAKDQYEPNVLLAVFSIDITKAVALSQGFKVDLNDMHGKMKKQSSYSSNNLDNPISYTENFYNVLQASDHTYKFNHKFPVIKSADGIVDDINLGKDIDLMTDFREHESQTITINPEFNLDVLAALFPIPIPSLFSPFMMETVTYRSASMLKVVNHYSMLDSVVVVDKGSMVSTKNMLYDAETGDVLLTRTQNEHNQPIYNFNYPSHWGYEGMGLAYKNIDAAFDNIEFHNGKITAGMDSKSINEVFESGDELYVISKNPKGPNFDPVCEQPNTELLPENLYDPQKGGQFIKDKVTHNIELTKNNAERVWAINTQKVGSLTPEWYFIDRAGNGYTAKDVSIRIIRSGKRNILGSSLGNIVSLNSPIQKQKLVFDNTTKIIQSAGAIYKDHWRVDDELYLKKIPILSNGVQTTIQIPLKHCYYSNDDISIVDSNCMVSKSSSGIMDGTFVGANNRLTNCCGRLNSKSFLLFDFSKVSKLTSDKLVSAKLTLYGHTKMEQNGDCKLGEGDGFLFSDLADKSKSCRATMYSSQSGHLSSAPHLNSNTVSFKNPSTNVYLYNNNSVLIKRMTGPWLSSPNNYSISWADYFKDQSTFIDHNVVSLIPATWHQQLQPVSVQNLSASDIDYAGDNSIDVTDIVKSMMDVGSNYATNPYIATGIRLEMPVQDILGTENRQCFMGLSNGSCDQYQPSIELTYIKCSERPYEKEGGNPIVCGYNIDDCYSKYTENKSINPYTQGVWGNWRADTTYVYYGNREQSSVNDAIDLRTAGVIKDYKPFWNFDSKGVLLRNRKANDVWIWNSTTTQFNRKGYDVENKDPLGRYNAGLYGYNDQLPIAVINNSRYRESMFDGFEDYDYFTDPDLSVPTSCKASRHADFGEITNLRSDKEKHSGKYSLAIEDGKTVSLNVPINNTDGENEYWMRVRVDSSKANAYVLPVKGSCKDCGTPSFKLPSAGYNNITWKKYFVAPVTGDYYFRAKVDDGVDLDIIDLSKNNTIIKVITALKNQNPPVYYGNSIPLKLDYGHVYGINLYYSNSGGENGSLEFMWRHPGITSFDYIPSNLLFDQQPTVPFSTVDCTSLDSINVRGNALTDHFSLIPGEKVVLSAWVKEDNKDCKASSYFNNQISVLFSSKTVPNPTAFAASGPIIEGWQRYESIIEVPNDAENIVLNLTSLKGTVYFDDIRIHPYNANMKSFVYHPYTLKLMAELDENNYATFYEYDDDGTLTRLKKETERGIKTIKETRSALQKAIQ